MTSLPVRILFLGFCLFSFQLAVLAEEDQATLDSILQRHLTTLGGEEAISSIESLRIGLTIQEPGFVIRGDYRATRSGLMRIDIYDGDTRVYSEGIDEKGGWQQPGDGAPVSAISEAGLQALLKGIERNFHGLSALAERNIAATYLGSKQVDDVEHDIVELTAADGSKQQLFLDRASGLIRRSRETSALHPDLDPNKEPLETVFSQHEPHCGVLRSMREATRNLRSGEEIQYTAVESVHCNLTLAELELQRPDS